MTRTVAAAVTLLSFVVLVSAAAAQTVRGTVQGLITDVTGAPIGGVHVVVTGESNGVSSATRSDDVGWFVVSSLAPGAYRLDVSHDGFRRHLQPFMLLVNQRLRLDVQLQTGPITEVVTVEAPRGAIEIAPGSLSTRFLPERVANLPLDGRNFLELALLTAGAAPSASGSAGSVRGDFALHVHGAREDANAYLLDGAYNLDPKLNGVAVRPPVEAIREFEVVRSVPDASFGRAAGAQVNVVTRSGSNQFSATAYEFFRTRAFDARNAFAPEVEPAPAYQRHQYGVALGGPIARGRLFFFGDYEGTRLREGITRVTNVPTLLERDGDFSASLLPPPTIPGVGVPFPDNRIPVEMQHPIGRAIAKLYPEPNRNAPFANFVSSPELEDDVRQFDARTDLVGARFSIAARYSFSDRDLFEPFAGPSFAAVPGFGNTVPRRAQNFVLSGVHAIGSRWIHEPRLAWTRVSTGVFQEDQGTSVNRLLGLPELSANPRDWGLSFISVAGFSSLGHEFNNPQEGRASHVQISDALTWSRGRHLLKMGGEGRLLAQDAFRDVQARGLLQFTQQAFTGNALADLLMGLPTVTVGARVDNPQRLRASSYALFFQDVMQLSPALTFSAGVRYEVNEPAVDEANRVSLYDSATGLIVPVGEAGMPRGGYDADRNNIAPRVGLAWAANDNTILRGGYGIAYDQAALAPNEFLYFNPPYFDLNTYFTIPGLYTLTLTDPFPAEFPLALPKSATAVQRDLQTGYLHQWNVVLQRRLGDRRSIEAAYVGSLGRNLVAARDLNQPAPSPDAPNLRPNPLFADILVIESRGRSRYHAFELEFDQRLSRGVSVTTTYTLAESKDDVSGFFASGGDANFPMDSNNPRREWARSNFDVRHRFTMAGVWELPFGPGRRWFTRGTGAACFGNWDVYFIATAQSGRPFTVAIHPDVDNSNTGRANLGFGANDRPDLVGDPQTGAGTADRWFNPAAFAMPAFGTFGNTGRNTLEGPGFRNVNVAFARRLPVGPGAFQLRLEIFNAFNRINLDQPDNFFLSPTFGQILSAGPPRRIQLAAKYTW